MKSVRVPAELRQRLHDLVDELLDLLAAPTTTRRAPRRARVLEASDVDRAFARRELARLGEHPSGRRPGGAA